MPDEVIDPEAAAVVIRELSKLCNFKNFTEDDEDETLSKMSHRSHDNIGYVRSPLIECASLEAESNKEGDMLYAADEDVSDDEDRDGLLNPDLEAVSDEGIPHGVELLG